MIHANRIVTVGEQESIIDRPIVLYRGDREVEIEFTLVGNEFTFSEEGNVIKSVNASHGQLVLNTPSGEHMFSELAECHEGKVVFVVTKEMIDEFIEVGFYSFQIRLYDSAEMKSRVTIPPVMNGFDIRNPIAAEDEANAVDQAIVGYARIFKDQSDEELPTFDWTGAYNKTEWVHHDVITANKMNKIEDALYSINAHVNESDVVVLNTLNQVKKDADAYVKEHIAEVEADAAEFERNLNTGVEKFKVDTNAAMTAAMTAHKNEVSDELESVNSQLEQKTSELNSKIDEVANKGTTAEVVENTTITVINEKINNGEMANLTIGEGSIELNKLIPNDKKNIASSLKFTKNQCVNHNNGEIFDNGSVYCSTDFLELEPNVEYVICGKNFDYEMLFFRGAYYDNDKNFIGGIVSSNKIVLEGINKKYVRFTVDSRKIDTQNHINIFFGSYNDFLIRKQFGMLYLPTINSNNYVGGVEASSISENAYIPDAVKKEITSDKNLENGLLYFNCNNLLDISQAQEKKTLNLDGTIASTNASTGVVDVEHIIGGEFYTFPTGSYNVAVAWWLNEQKEPISKLDTSIGTQQAPENAKYLRCFTNYSNLNSLYSSKIYVNKGKTSLGYSEYKNDYKINEKYLSGSKGNKDWSTYKYRAIGDSRTAGYNSNIKDDEGNFIWDEDVANNYPSFIEYYTGIHLENKSVPGASFCTRSTVNGIPTMFEQALNLPFDTDIITIFGMSNDRIIGVSSPNHNPINERDNLLDKYDTTTFKGAIRQTIKNIKMQAPYCTIIFLTEDCEPAHDGGQTKKDMIEEIAKEHKIPTLNLSNCAMTGTISDEYMEQKHHCYTDGLHESVFGQKLMAKAVAGEMSKYLW